MYDKHHQEEQALHDTHNQEQVEALLMFRKNLDELLGTKLAGDDKPQPVPVDAKPESPAVDVKPKSREESRKIFGIPRPNKYEVNHPYLRDYLKLAFKMTEEQWNEISKRVVLCFPNRKYRGVKEIWVYADEDARNKNRRQGIYKYFIDLWINEVPNSSSSV